MTVRPLCAAAVLAVVTLTGCHLVERIRDKDKPLPGPPTFSRYLLDGWQWDQAGRVLVLPFRNESQYTRAGDEAREAFIAEMQKMGRFEVIPTAADDRAYLAALARCSGRFDEALLYDIACATGADVVVYGVVTNYSPYPRPRLGWVIQAVGPKEAKVVASVDGLWDSTDAAIAERIRLYYRQRSRERPPWVRNHTIASDDSFAGELALDSPNLFRRFVARESVISLLGYPVPGVAYGADPTALGDVQGLHLGEKLHGLKPDGHRLPRNRGGAANCPPGGDCAPGAPVQPAGGTPAPAVPPMNPPATPKP